MTDLLFFAPFHTNLCQLENLAPFWQRFGGAAFIYEWNPDKEKLRAYLNPTDWPLLTVRPFTLKDIVEELFAHPEKKIVWLLTASSNYTFANTQRDLIGALQKAFPDRIVDCFNIGHCMYGCQSCGLREHNVPLKFTRFVNGELPFGTADVRAKYLGEPRPAGSLSVLVCPSVGPLSFLSSAEILGALAEGPGRATGNGDRQPVVVAIHRRSPPTSSTAALGLAEQVQSQARATAGAALGPFVLKLHSFCQCADSAEEPHPILGIGEEERAMVPHWREALRTVPEEECNILPFLDGFDVILTDLDSSVAFESLYFAQGPRGKYILAYCNDPAQRAQADQAYLGHLNLFSNGAELRALFARLPGSPIPGAHPAEPLAPLTAGREFFGTKYGIPTGGEVDRAAQLRKWAEKVSDMSPFVSLLWSFGGCVAAPCPHAPPSWLSRPPIAPPPAPALIDGALGARGRTGRPGRGDAPVPHDPVTYLARGEPIPDGAAEFTVFLRSHQEQLEAIQLPAPLWHPLYRKLRAELFDAASVVQFAPVARVEGPPHGPAASCPPATLPPPLGQPRAWPLLFPHLNIPPLARGPAGRPGGPVHPLQGLQTCNKEGVTLRAGEQVFLVDHSWTTTAGYALAQRVSGLSPRISGIAHQGSSGCVL
ncbi:putative Tubulin-tyrosine ligase family protein [Paratrimastix pyriformis]|uniref:Tubulin-tyrosine ligase family protein n=1 Tax=Paratrimastix pyriformis TaxID=342808 RepID=A0ABQ8UQ97_9EUKA|nr:putative Tubulin-tyrosine ligase family protein [Paratrimastix pyriformis]